MIGKDVEYLCLGVPKKTFVFLYFLFAAKQMHTQPVCSPLCVCGRLCLCVSVHLYLYWNEIIFTTQSAKSEVQAKRPKRAACQLRTGCKSKRINCALANMANAMAVSVSTTVSLTHSLCHSVCVCVCVRRELSGLQGESKGYKGRLGWLWIRCKNANFRHWVVSLLCALCPSLLCSSFCLLSLSPLLSLPFALWFSVCE